MRYHPFVRPGKVCRLFGKTRQAWYKQRKAALNIDMSACIVLERVRELRRDIPVLGGRKLHHLLSPSLREHSITIGRDKLFDLLAAHNMLVRRRRRRKAVTTDSGHPFYKYPNLVKDIEVLRPDHVWVSDITYLRLSNGFAYLSLVTDAYSRKVLGYCLYPTLERTGPLQAVGMAISGCNRKLHRPLIHHSDRGLQYCCSDYTSLMKDHRITISMTENGDPYENAIAERMNGVLKYQFDLNRTFGSFTEAEAAVKEVIYNYNNLYPHGSCNYLTPEQAHTKMGKLHSKWKTTTVN